MSDVTPNYQLEAEGIRVEIAQLELNIKSQNFRIMQLDDEKRRIDENKEATRVKIAELNKQLKELQVNG